MPDAFQPHEDLELLLTDYTTSLRYALARGDAEDAATALATIRQAADQALLHLDPHETIAPAFTHFNGRYVGPALDRATRWGRPLRTFQNRDEFYAAYPELAVGWEDATHTDVPLGPDVFNDKDSVVTLCAPSKQASASPQGDVTGVATEYDRKTGEIRVLAENITHAAAERRFK